MYPIRFENLYYEKIWGGRDFEDFRNNLPEGMIGESWDIACHKNGMGVVANGKYKGINFEELIIKEGKGVLGTKVSSEKFPLLIKLINSKENLSVQVHPGDEYAAKYENEFGKTEAWYVIDAKPGATLIVGTKDCDKEIFAKAIEEGKSEDFLNKIEVKKGDCFLIDSGLVHAICEGVIIAEIQQNSDVTYRVYDYGRPREIHVEKALDVIKFDLQCKNLKGEEKDFGGFKRSLLCKNEYFGIEKYTIETVAKQMSDEERFHMLTCVEGSGQVVAAGYIEEVKTGDSILIPANLGQYEIKGNLVLLKSYSV